MQIQQLIDEAYALHHRMNNIAYQRLCVYSHYPSYVAACETDPLVLRLDRLLGQSLRRISRRVATKYADRYQA